MEDEKHCTIMPNYYNLKFRGASYLNIKTVSPDYDTPDIIDQNGFLCIDGYKITKNKEGIRTIQNSLTSARISGSNDLYFKCEYRIDDNGYVILENQTVSGNKGEYLTVNTFKKIGKFLSMLCGG